MSLYTYLPMKMEQIDCSETSAYKIQTPENYPEANIQQMLVSFEQLVTRRSLSRPLNEGVSQIKPTKRKYKKLDRIQCSVVTTNSTRAGHVFWMILLTGRLADITEIVGTFDILKYIH